ncbi:MAG: hypothetical protein Q7K33_02475 [Candidatus Berkelbacteria bacterium]|nr:hypothetical protein [Candidatus Berkelbacteria bacterium]
MKVRALLFVIFTVCLFALGVLVTTIFNTAPATNDAVAMFYASLFITLFGLIFFLLIAFTRLQTHVNPGLAALKVMLRFAVITDVLIVALLALKANNVLNWATSIVLVVVAIIIGVVLKKRTKQ